MHSDMLRISFALYTSYTRIERSTFIQPYSELCYGDHGSLSTATFIQNNTKNCSLSIVLTATDQKPQKSLKKSYYPPSHCLNVNVMLSNMTFLMIFAVFDPSPLTL